MKFGRVYQMQAQGTNFPHTIQFPLTCRFAIDNASMPYGGATATFLVYNLAPETRRDLNKDYFLIGEYRQVLFNAGYSGEGPNLPLVFQGNIQTAYSYRQGPDWITELQCFDGGYARHNSQLDLSQPSPYQIQTVLRQAISTMAPNNVSLGALGNFDLPNNRGLVFSGRAWEFLQNNARFFQAHLSINKEKIYMLNLDEYIEAAGTVDLIDADTGLLESPRHVQQNMICRMLFEPRLEMFQMVQMDSQEPGNSGQFKVLRTRHTGTISGAVCDTLVTEVTLYRALEDMKQIDNAAAAEAGAAA